MPLRSPLSPPWVFNTFSPSQVVAWMLWPRHVALGGLAAGGVVGGDQIGQRLAGGVGKAV
ncbi:MAG: hypothetical protein HC922_04540 [Leptolyngbyaceae cyanobacterium SM2_3_12]|nr:hypothetical protein [Leptolyngbyaceae cyanobacterium SM2_3_12]